MYQFLVYKMKFRLFSSQKWRKVLSDPYHLRHFSNSVIFADSHINFYVDSKITGQINHFFTSIEHETDRTILKQNIPEEPRQFLSHTRDSRIYEANWFSSLKLDFRRGKLNHRLSNNTWIPYLGTKSFQSTRRSPRIYCMCSPTVSISLSGDAGGSQALPFCHSSQTDETSISLDFPSEGGDFRVTCIFIQLLSDRRFIDNCGRKS